MTRFDKHVAEMRGLAGHLVPYSFPLVSPVEEETISWMKKREIELDGYEIVVYFNKCEYADFNLESLQVFGKYFTFLPFALVCKVAYLFLGTENLSLIEVLHNKGGGAEQFIDENSRKIYVWTLYWDKSGEKMVNPFASNVKHRYESFEFTRVDREEVTFF